ncbi:hypothetical protein ACEQ8H_008933 [Pleosporales sp. CAS-2024a]
MITSNREAFHVSIVGAGIAGLALAMGLHKKGISFTIYEAAKEYSVVGAGIGFGPNGMQALDLIEPGFRPLYEAICTTNKGKGTEHIFFEGQLIDKGLGHDQPWFGNSSWGHPDYVRRSAHRKELLDIMTSFIPIENVQFNKALESIEQQSDKVVLKFADGETTEATLVVGSDGIKSIVREDVLGSSYPDEVAPVYASTYAYRAVLPMEEVYPILGTVSDIAKNYFGHGRGVVQYRITGGTEVNFLFIKRDPNPWSTNQRAMTETTTHEAMMADFEGQDMDPRLLQILAKHRPVKWGLFHHARTSTYYRRRTILMGDAAHASMPYQAAGAAQGVEDALVLTQVLAKVAEAHGTCANTDQYIQAAAKAYDGVRRPRAQHQLERADQVGRMLMRIHETNGSDVTKSIRMLQNRWHDWLWFHDLQADVDKALADMQQSVQAQPCSSN